MSLRTLSLKHKVVVVVIILSLVSGLFIGFRQFLSDPSGNVVASVNGEKITKDELYQLLLKQAGQQRFEPFNCPKDR